ncbi:MAG: hypothetical protein P1U65_07755 [Minwuia sp.]|nr:hypothetical protein [Minwuia sp.]
MTAGSAQRLPLLLCSPSLYHRHLEFSGSCTEPIVWTAETLIKRIDLPPHWDDQKTLLGFS